MKLKTEEEFEWLETLINEKIQNLVDKYEERLEVLERETASAISVEEDEKKYEEARRKEQEEFNTMTTDSIQNILFCLGGIWRSNGMRSKAKKNIQNQVYKDFTDKLGKMMRSWRDLEIEFEQDKDDKVAIGLKVYLLTIVLKMIFGRLFVYW